MHMYEKHDICMYNWDRWNIKSLNNSSILTNAIKANATDFNCSLTTGLEHPYGITNIYYLPMWVLSSSLVPASLPLIHHTILQFDFPCPSCLEYKVARGNTAPLSEVCGHILDKREHLGHGKGGGGGRAIWVYWTERNVLSSILHHAWIQNRDTSGKEGVVAEG